VANRLNRPQHVQPELGNVSVGWHREIVSAQKVSCTSMKEDSAYSSDSNGHTVCEMRHKQKSSSSFTTGTAQCQWTVPTVQTAMDIQSVK